jgi:alkylhydroperoxidase family enzyme
MDQAAQAAGGRVGPFRQAPRLSPVPGPCYLSESVNLARLTPRAVYGVQVSAALSIIASDSLALHASDRVLIAVTDDVLARQALSDDTWQAARQTLTEREIIEACLLIGHYQGLASAIGALGIQLEDGLNEAPAPGGPAAPRTC